MHIGDSRMPLDPCAERPRIDRCAEPIGRRNWDGVDARQRFPVCTRIALRAVAPATVVVLMDRSLHISLALPRSHSCSTMYATTRQKAKYKAANARVGQTMCNDCGVAEAAETESTCGGARNAEHANQPRWRLSGRLARGTPIGHCNGRSDAPVSNRRGAVATALRAAAGDNAFALRRARAFPRLDLG